MSLWKDKQMVDDEITWLKDKLHADPEARGARKMLQRMREVLTISNIRDLGTIIVLATVQSCDSIYSYSIVMAKMAGFKMNEYFAGIILETSLAIRYFIAPYLIEKLRYNFCNNLMQKCSGFALQQEEDPLHDMWIAGSSNDGLVGSYDPPSVQKINDYRLQSEISRLPGEALLSYHKVFLGSRKPGFLISLIKKVLPMASFLASTLLFGASLGAIPFTLLGELLDEEVRNFGTSLSIFIKYRDPLR